MRIREIMVERRQCYFRYTEDGNDVDPRLVPHLNLNAPPSLVANVTAALLLVQSVLNVTRSRIVYTQLHDR